jgi:hypothetical protein
VAANRPLIEPLIEALIEPLAGLTARHRRNHQNVGMIRRECHLWWSLCGDMSPDQAIGSSEAVVT